MKRWIIGILVLLLQWQLKAQLYPVSDLYTHNRVILNPAFSGSEGALNVSLQHRNQWTGFSDAPITNALTIHAPINRDRTGLGFMVTRNTYGIYKKTSIMGNYAHRIPLDNGIFAMGIGFGITSYRMAWDQLEATDPDDPELAENPETSLLPDFSVGFCYYTRDFFIGCSLPFFMSHVQNENTGKMKMQNIFSRYNYYITGGYAFEISRTANLVPSAVIRYQPEGGFQTDFLLRWIQWNRIGAGAGYRSSKMWIAQVECKANDQFRVVYSYDSGFGKMQSNRGATHEIMIGYTFSYKRDVMSPRNF